MAERPFVPLPERVAASEVKIEGMKEDVADIKNDLANVNKKLDDLLTLKHKGVGAFWLASSLLGTGIVGFLVSVFGFFKDKF